MKFVAVSQSVDLVSDRKEYRDALDHNIARFLLTCGFISVPVPNIFQDTVLEDFLNPFMKKLKPHALVLSGGNSLGESREKDETELAMISYAEQKGLPLLGICRGMQMMAYRAGINPVRRTGHAGIRHQINGEISGYVNSYHDFCILECPKDYEVTSECDQKTIESIKHRKLPWEGWMWHPEREPIFDKRDVERITALFNSCGPTGAFQD